MMSLLWLRVAAVFYAVAGATAFPAVLYGRPRWQRVSLPAAVAGFFFHLVAVVELMVAAHHLVPLGWVEVQATLALLIVAAYLLVYAAYRTAAFGIIALPLALVLLVAPAMGANSGGFVTPEMRSGWLVVHIGALLAAYTALLFSLIASVLYLVQERRLKSKAGVGFLACLPQPADRLPLHDGRTAGGLADCAAKCRGCLLSRSQGAALLWDVGAVCADAAGSPQHRAARTAGNLSLERGLPRRAQRLGGKPVQLRAQVSRPMTIRLLGVNHRTAPIELRERLAIAPESLGEATRALMGTPGVREGMIVSTCNRVELVTSYEQGAPDVMDFMHRYFALEAEVLRPHLYEYEGADAVRHLFRVASSLDSMVLGEPQILGQVKEAYTAARSVGAVQTSLERLLQTTFTVAKRVRTETQIGTASVSIASVAVDLAKKIFGSLDGKTVLLVGAGKMSELAARHLIQQGARSILIANRTFDRAVGLAETFGGRAVRFEDLHAVADQADIVITSTGAAQPIFRREHAQQFLQRRRNRPMFYIDIAVPRDVAPEVNRLEGAFVYDIDDLQSVAASHMSERTREAMQAEAIVQAAVERFAAGQQTLSAVPAIVSLQQSMEELRQGELQRMQGKLQSLSAEQRSAVEALTRGLINKVLHQPLQAMKVAARSGDLTVAEAVQQIFGLQGGGLQGGELASQGSDAAAGSDAEPPREEVASSTDGAAKEDAVPVRGPLEASRR
jgi:glutamyl-tRNA reductase